MTTLGATLCSTCSGLRRVHPRAGIARRIVHTIAVALTATLATNAGAQIQRLALSGIERDALQPYYVRSDLAIFAETLKLSDDQRTIVDSIFADYEAAIGKGTSDVRSQLRELAPLRRATDDLQRETRDRLRKRSRTMRDELRKKIEEAADAETRSRLLDDFQKQVRELQNELQDTSRSDAAQDPELTRQTGEILQSWEQRKRQIRTKLESNTQTVLDAGQAARWTALDRTLRRRKTIGRGQLSGESVDLTRLVDELAFEPATAAPLAEVIDAYEIDLDGALRARNDGADATRDEQLRLLREGVFDLGKSIGRDRVELHVAVRDVNEAYVQRLIAALPEAAASRLRHAYNIRAFPRVYRATRGTRAFDAAKQVQGLGEETAETIGSLEAAYRAQLAQMNDRLREVIRRNEPDEHRRRFERLAAAGKGKRLDPAEDPIRALYDARREFDSQYITNIEGLLTEEQLAQMPRSARSLRSVARPERAERELRPEAVERFDLNGDGEIDEAELDRMRKFMQRRRAARSGG